MRPAPRLGARVQPDAGRPMSSAAPVVSLFDRSRPALRRSAERAAGTALSHLDQLEAEAIHIIREAAAESENPVLLYSIGKDSSVLLHLALKAFYPGKPPFPLLHIDTTWKFRDMI